MSRYETYFKWAVILVIAVFVFLMLRRCGNDVSYTPSSNDTLSKKVDTVWMEGKRDTQYIPQVKTSYISKIEKQYIHDTLEIYEYERLDSVTQKYLREYISYKTYKDSISTQYGYIKIYDTVHLNKIVQRKIESRFDVPVVKETITLTRSPRAILYIGGNLLGNQQTPLWGAGGSLGLKARNDKIYEVGAVLNKTGQTMYTIGFKIPIKFKR